MRSASSRWSATSGHAGTPGPVAVLYQTIPPPLIGGVRKPMKPGGYSDSGADIAYVLRSAGQAVVTPAAEPRIERDLDWVFPDDAAGIAAARQAGAEVLWANTILFRGHPLESVVERDLRARLQTLGHSQRARRSRSTQASLRIVGQPPALVDRFDDKWAANARLRQQGCAVVRGLLVGAVAAGAEAALEEMTEDRLRQRGLTFPVVIKPVRGRGSAGVQRVADLPALQREGRRLLEQHGETFIAEEFLAGEEITITVMPPGDYRHGAGAQRQTDYWALPIVRRFHHQDGIAPYSGVVSVVENSAAIPAEALTPELIQAARDCVLAAQTVGAKAPIRVDCRQASIGEYRLFDLNLKPNMTGAGRPGRERQDSLTCLAARALGWSYADLLLNLLGLAWPG